MRLGTTVGRDKKQGVEKMYVTPNGESVFVVDTHVHMWDARPENRRNEHGLSFIECFWGAHAALSPTERKWSYEDFLHYGVDRTCRDLFDQGYCDHAVLQPTDLKEFYVNGFNSVDQQYELKKARPEQIILNGRIDPREGQRGLDKLEREHEFHKFKGVKMYTAEWLGASKGYSLKDDFVAPYMEKLMQLGIKNVHLHKGPTIHPLSLDAFDVRDVDHVATDFPKLNFIVEHCGMPRIDDFSWIALQEPNVYGGLALITSFIHRRPKYFAQMMSELLFFVGPDRLTFGSDYAIFDPNWVIERLWDFQFDDELAQEAGGQITNETKRKILGLNAAKLYGLDVPEIARLPNAA